MYWVYALIGIWVIILVYPVLRMYSVNRIVSGIITIILLMIAMWLVDIYIKPHYLAWERERMLRLEFPIVTYAAINSPEEFQKYISKVRDNVKSKGDINNEMHYQGELLNALLVKYGPYASDESLFNYLKRNAELDQKLFSMDPALVLFHEFPEKFTNAKINFGKLNQNEYLQTTFDAVESVIKTGAEKPRTLPTEDEKKKAMETFRQVVSKLSEKYGEKVVIKTLQQPSDPTLDKNTSAKIVMAFFDGIIATGQSSAGLFMRVTLMINTPDKH